MSDPEDDPSGGSMTSRHHEHPPQTSHGDDHPRLRADSDTGPGAAEASLLRVEGIT
jgi:hypothetical protein